MWGLTFEALGTQSLDSGPTPTFFKPLTRALGLGFRDSCLQTNVGLLVCTCCESRIGFEDYRFRVLHRSWSEPFCRCFSLPAAFLSAQLVPKP